MDEAGIELTIFEGRKVVERYFDLIYDQWFGEIGVEEIDHARPEIADAEIFHQFAIGEVLEGFGDFHGIHQKVGPVELEQINLVDFEAF